MGKPIVFTKAHVKSYTRADGTFVQAHETTKDSAVPDEHNPKMALQGIPTHALSATVKGHEDLNRRAKVELANRGLDSDGKWIGFNQAEKHHGVKTSTGEPDEVGSHFQTFHPKVLSAAAKGKHDFNTHARDELANRGLDSDGKWVGFKTAKEHHAALARKAAAAGKPQGKEPVAAAPKDPPADHVDAGQAGKPPGVKPEAKPKSKKVAPKLDPHPNVIGKAKVKDQHAMEFEGREYWKTGKQGRSMHDGTPVEEYEHSDSGHRVWKDDKDRVHADSTEEAKKYRKGK